MIKISNIKLPAFHYQNNDASVLHFAVCPFVIAPEQSSLAHGFSIDVYSNALLWRATTALVWTLEDRWTGALSARKHQQVVHCDRSRLEPLFSRLPDLNGVSPDQQTRNENEG